MDLTGTIFEIQHFAVYDGPGIRTVIYLKGCPLRCLWCHNPEGLSPKPQTFYNTKTKAMERSGYSVSVSSLINEILIDRPFFGAEGGLTLSGGEPMLQPEFSCALLENAKARGIHTCLETSGHCSPRSMLVAAEVTDLFLFDIKETDDQLHRKYTGVSNRQILDNLTLLNDRHAKIILRCPIIPGLNLRPDHFKNIAVLAEKTQAVEAIELEPYHPLGLSKYADLGMTPGYSNTEFLDPQELTGYAAEMKSVTRKPVRLSTGIDL